MDNYIVSARKYRPRKFSEVVGQEALTSTLKNSIAEGRLAHAYLFCGPRGVGKTTCARIFAKTINCEHKTPDGEPCDACESCRAFNEGRSLNIYELDAASNNTVDDIRQIIEQVAIPPQYGRYKVFIIDEVHMLSKAAFNAFLKTLEEPPAHVIFILATTEKQKILPTILSRCQIYDFARMSVEQIVQQLKMVSEHEGYKYDEEALSIIAQKADGGMRDALSLLDQVASFTRGEIFYDNVVRNLNVLDYDYYFRLTDAFLKHDTLTPLLLFNEILGKGFDGEQFVGGLTQHMRDLLVSRDESTLPLLEVAEQTRRRYRDQAARASVRFLYKAMALLNRCGLDYRNSANKRLLVELTLIEVSQIGQDEAPADAGPGPANQLKPIFTQTQRPATTTAAAQSKATQATAATQPVVAPKPTPVLRPTKTVAMPQQTHAPAGFTSFADILKNSKQPQTDQPTTTTAGATAATQQPATQQPARLTDIDEQSVQLAWIRFASSLPREEVATAGVMRQLTPQKVAAGSFSIEVDSQPFLNMLSPIVPRFEQAVHTELGANIHVELHLQANTNQTTQKPLSPTERLALIKEQYAPIAKLANALNLEVK